MTQKQGKFNRDKFRRDKIPQYVERRPVLFSYDDVNRMAVESSQARLISQLVSKPEEFPHSEFASYFHGPLKDTDPYYAVTSHSIATASYKPVIPAFPSLVGLRWNPHVETSSIETSQTDITAERKKFHCRCDNCNTKHCPSRVSSSSTMKTIVRSNIMTFSDKYTMTPKLRDAYCGCCTISSTPKTSDVSVAACDTAGKDMQYSAHFNQPRYQGNPIPILKKQYDDLRYTCDIRKNEMFIDIHHEPERDTDQDYQDPVKTKSVKSFIKFKRNDFRPEFALDHQNPRNILYNEGISDMVANHNPMTPIRIPSPTNVKNNRFVMSKCFIPEKGFKPLIPYSHNLNSRYHNTCKRGHTKFRNEEDDVRHLVASPQMVRRTYTSKPTRHYRVPSIRLPKKVLSSERDIESYIEKSEPKVAHAVKQK